MPWFEIDGASIYDRLHEPGFHLLLFLDGKTDVPPLPRDLMERWVGLIDTHIFSTNETVAKTFGTNKPFFVLLRPDNYIGLIADEFSPDLIVKYLDRF